MLAELLLLNSQKQNIWIKSLSSLTVKTLISYIKDESSILSSGCINIQFIIYEGMSILIQKYSSLGQAEACPLIPYPLGLEIAQGKMDKIKSFVYLYIIYSMIIISILSLLLSNAVNSRRDISILYNRIAMLILIYCILNDIASLTVVTKGIGLHGGLLLITNLTQIFHIFLFIVSILILTLTSFYPRKV